MLILILIIKACLLALFALIFAKVCSLLWIAIVETYFDRKRYKQIFGKR